MDIERARASSEKGTDTFLCVEWCPSPFSEKCFQNHEILTKDLQAFAEALGVASYLDIRFTRFLRSSAMTESGEEVTGNAYLYQWVRTTGITKTDEAGRKKTGKMLFAELIAQISSVTADS